MISEYVGKSTAHIVLKEGTHFAETVLFPGDPKRATWIAETFLKNSVLVTDVRGMMGYTGTYRGMEISVMGSGMGMPSVGIYAHELYANFGVQNIIRVGTAGGISDNVEVGDVVLAMSASTDSSWQDAFVSRGHYAPTADFDLIRRATVAAYISGYRFHVGNIFATDNYYHSDITPWKALGALCCDMETAALYSEAAITGKKALTILTVSNIIGDDDSETSVEERERSFSNMVEIAIGVIGLEYLEAVHGQEPNREEQVRDLLRKLVIGDTAEGQDDRKEYLLWN